MMKESEEILFRYNQNKNSLHLRNPAKPRDERELMLTQLFFEWGFKEAKGDLEFFKTYCKRLESEIRNSTGLVKLKKKLIKIEQQVGEYEVK